MKAVIMCGGLGSRLRPLTEIRPKPLVRILNVPVLELILRRLSETEGVKDVYLSLGYKAQEIIEFCERKQFGATLHYCEEDRPLGTAGGVKNCLNASDEPVCVLSGDNLFETELGKVLAYHTAAGADVTVVGREVSDPREYGTIIKDAENRILSFVEKPTWEQAQSTLINTGIYMLSPTVLDLIPPGRYFDFSEHLFPLLLEEKKSFYCYTSNAFWADIGEFRLYRETSAALLQKDDLPRETPGRRYTRDFTDGDGNTMVAPCLVGPGVKLGSNNRIGPNTVIGPGTVIGDGCCIRDAVVGEDATVEDHSDVLGAIVDDHVLIGANCVVEKDAVIAYGAEIGKFSRVLSGVRVWPGKKTGSESVLSADMFYESPEALEVDLFGVSGRIFSQFTVSDAAKLGQAIASVKGMQRIGVGCDRKNSSGIYRSLCAAGIRSCGVICYDFEEIFKAQAFFYSAYCSLDAFIYISTGDETVNFSFFGKNGLPVSAKTARAVNNNFRFSAFRFASERQSTDVFRMHLLSTAYTAALHRALSCGISGRVISVECENRCLKTLFRDFLAKAGAAEGPGGLQFLLNENGTDMYCIENDRFYSSDRIKAALCELEFAENSGVIVPEDAPSAVERIAGDYGAPVTRLYENAGEQTADPRAFLENLWNFDAVFLCVKLLRVLVTGELTVEELLSSRRSFFVRKKVIELDCPPSLLRDKIKAAGAGKNAADVYYTLKNAKGTARLRQLGNLSRVRVLVEAADMETAKELTAEINAKFSRERG